MHKYYVFFDVDGTLINIKSMFSFLQYYYCGEQGESNAAGYKQYLQACDQCGIAQADKYPRETINRGYYKLFSGISMDRLMSIGVQWYQHVRTTNNHLFNAGVVDELQKHKCSGAGIVLVSGSFVACLQPIADQLQADYILSSNLELANGRCTGNLLEPQTTGQGKAQAMRLFAIENELENLNDCYAYGDHISDLPMLKMVGNPIAVSGDVELTAYAEQCNWTIVGD